MTVRPEVNADIAAIHDLHAIAFPTLAEARLVDALRAAGHLILSLVAAGDDGLIAGHLAFSPVTIDDTSVGVGLAPVAVLPAYRCRGIAAHLIREGLGRCRDAGYGFVVVLGEPEYYARFGFKRASTWGLRDEYGGGAAFQAFEVRPDAIPSNGGLVRYAPGFAALA